MILFRIYGLYDGDVKRISHSPLDDLPALFHAFVLGTLVAWIAYRLLPVHRIVFFEAMMLGAAGILWTTVLRNSARRILTRQWGPERVVLVGGSARAEILLRKMRTHPEYALRPVGFVAFAAGSPDLEIPLLGQINSAESAAADFERALGEQAVERIIISAEEVGDETLLALVRSAGQKGIKVGILPRHIDALGPSLQVDDVEGLTVLELNPLVLPRFSRLAKRIMDVGGAGLALVLALPVMAMIVLAIKIDSRGPVFFRQRRIGREGREFTLFKFRTMVPGAELQLDELKKRSQDPNWLKIADDPRVTRIGSVLRSFSLDEIPQLWNVLKGDMSLVGPRPLIGSEDELVKGWVRARLDLAPGLTGLWQVLGRTTIPFEEMVKLDYVYVTNWSLWSDIRLIVRTIPVVLGRRGAN